MAKGKNVLTTGDVARICNVAARTVSKWFDSGQLKGYRIPGSKDRRIPVSELLCFMKAHDMPTAKLPVGKVRVLVVSNNGNMSTSMVDSLRTNSDYEVETARSNFETGVSAQKFSPHVLLINLLAEGIDATNICKHIRADEDLQTTKIIAVANELNDSERAALLRKGFDDCVTNCSDTTELIEKIESVTAVS